MRNIIFDMDGTLLDSMEMWENLGTLFLAKKGVKPPENLKEIIENKTLDESAEYFITELKMEGTISGIVQEILSLIHDKYYNELQMSLFSPNTKSVRKCAYLQHLTAILPPPP